MDTSNLIQSMDVCEVTSNKGLKGSGLSAGDIVMVVGTRVLPEKRNDPYLQRTYTIVCKFEGEKLMLPSSDKEDDTKAIVVDPRRLSKLDDERLAKYKEYVNEQYSS